MFRAIELAEHDIANPIKNKWIRRQKKNICEFKLFFFNQLVGQENKIKRQKENAQKSRSDPEMYSRLIRRGIPKKENKPCQEEGWIIQRFPVFIDGDQKNPNIDDRHVTK